MELTFNKNKLDKALNNYLEYSKNPAFSEDILERGERKKYISDLVSNEIDEVTLHDLITTLWSMRIWGNKDYVTGKILQENGLENLRKEFAQLNDAKVSVEDRYIKFFNNVKKMGTSTVTEILCHLEPTKAGIWNAMARKALAWLEISNVDTQAWKLNREQYAEFNKVVGFLSDYLKKNDLPSDYLAVDYFLYETAINLSNSEELNEKIAKPVKDKTRHEELKEKLEAIGSQLGFDTGTEKKIAQGAVLDVVWEARISNLGKVSYVFEVQDRGSIDGLILNLYKALNDPCVQKLVVVSDSEQIQKIKGEMSSLNESFRTRCVFWDSENVDRIYENLQEVTNSLAKLNLFTQ